MATATGTVKENSKDAAYKINEAVKAIFKKYNQETALAKS